MYKPPVISFDFESTGLDYWSPDFRVLSCAFAWRGENGEIKTRVVTGDDIAFLLRLIKNDGTPLVCHNVGFEYGVTKHCFPGYEDLIKFDTMRLAQVYDNGGTDSKNGRFGLSKCVERILQEANHKEPTYKFIRETFNVKPGQEKSYISQLPEDKLAEYNAADAVVTLKLYEKITTEFAKLNYDWTLDHSLYMNIAKHISMSKARGIAVDFDKLMTYQAELTSEIDEIDRKTNEYFSKFIAEIEEEKKAKWIAGPTTERGQEARRQKLADHEKVWKFNPRSKVDKETLLVTKQGVKPTFYTPKGSPSFAKAHIHTYGEGGVLMAGRNQRAFVLNQVNNLLHLSAQDFRYRPDLKATGTKTGRFAGGEVVNE